MLDVPEDLSLYEQLAGLKDYNYIFIPIKKYLFYFDLLTCPRAVFALRRASPCNTLGGDAARARDA